MEVYIGCWIYHLLYLYVKVCGLSFFQINYGSLDWLLLDTTAARENQIPQDVVIEE